jgi:hypothetical protein
MKSRSHIEIFVDFSRLGIKSRSHRFLWNFHHLESNPETIEIFVEFSPLGIKSRSHRDFCGIFTTWNQVYIVWIRLNMLKLNGDLLWCPSNSIFNL